MQIPWRLTGFVVQSGLVTAVLVVPMFYPEVISMTLPMIGVTLTAPPRQAVTVEQVSGGPASTSTAARQPVTVRRYVVPTAWDRPAATMVDEPGMYMPTVGPGVVTGSSVGVVGSVGDFGSFPPPVAVKKPEVKEPEVKRITVGGSVQEARLLRQVKPAYPPLARQARISGEVRLEAVIGFDGTVQQLRVVSGHPLLSGAALEAVRQWQYQATTLNGKPVEVATVISVRFLLGGG